MRRDKKLTDVHAHMEQYTSGELESVLRGADEAGVKWILTSGLDLQTSLQGMEIASSHEQVLASIGVHPWTAAENFPPDFDEKFPELVKKGAAVAVGEVGLDFIDKLRPSEFEFKNKPGKYHNGLIAQQVKEAMDVCGIEFSGWYEKDDGIQGLRYQEFILPLINAVKELKKEIEELKACLPTQLDR